jgi:cysteine desulfurase
MRPFFRGAFGNPSSFHAVGLEAKNAVMDAREKIAALFGAHADEIIVTSGGTESDNLAIWGIIQACASNGEKPHVITSTIEHHAVLEPLLYLEKMGVIELTKVPVDAFGLVHVEDVKEALKPTTKLVSIMYANNEIGTIQPIADIGRMLLVWRKEKKTVFPYFHSDACQAVGALDINVERLHVDLFAFNGSKLYGPKGVGGLFVRRGVRLVPMIRGGGQERGLRSGTENVPGIVGLATALALAQEEAEKENARLTKLRDQLIEGLLA